MPLNRHAPLNDPSSLGSLERLPRELLVRHILPHVLEAGREPVDQFMEVSRGTYRLVAETAISMVQCASTQVQSRNKILGGSATSAPPQIPIEALRSAHHVMTKIGDHPPVEYAESALKRGRYGTGLKRLWPVLLEDRSNLQALQLIFKHIDEGLIFQEVVKTKPLIDSAVRLHPNNEYIQENYLKFLRDVAAFDEIFELSEKFLRGEISVSSRFLANIIVGIPRDPNEHKAQFREKISATVFDRNISRFRWAYPSERIDLKCLSENFEHLTDVAQRDERLDLFGTTLRNVLKTEDLINLEVWQDLEKCTIFSTLTVDELHKILRPIYDSEAKILHQLLPFIAKCSGDVHFLHYVFKCIQFHFNRAGLTLNFLAYGHLLEGLEKAFANPSQKLNPSIKNEVLSRLKSFSIEPLYVGNCFHSLDDVLTWVRIEWEYLESDLSQYEKVFCRIFEYGNDDFVLAKIVTFSEYENSRGRKMPRDFLNELLCDGVLY